MKATLAKIIEILPDYEDLMSTAESISELSLKKMQLDIKIKAGESDVFKRASAEEKFFIGGKPAPTSFIENTYKYPGLSGELLPIRSELAAVTSALEKTRMKMDIYKSVMEIWRTLSANERSSSI